MTKKDFPDYYKEIEVKKLEDGIVVVNLWKDEKREIYNFVRLMFAYGNLIYTGDMGEFIFGRNVYNVFTFYKGDEIQPDYWAEKVYCSDTPIREESCDIVELEKLVREDVAEYFGEEELSEEYEETINDTFDYGFDPNPVRAYDAIHELYDELEVNTDNIGYLIAKSQQWNGRYLYACELIQWVSNNLDKWLKEI